MYTVHFVYEGTIAMLDTYTKKKRKKFYACKTSRNKRREEKQLSASHNRYF